jgi:methyl-accepting chemotaxis protein
MFVPAVEAGSAAYREFWRSLAAGEVVAGQFQRLAKDGHSVWLEATYNPVFDEQGQVVRVVKIAIDITDKVLATHEVTEKSVALERALQRGREAEIQREALDSALQELSTPVIPIWEGVLLLPLIGIVDSTRTEDILRKTLDQVNTTQAKIFILDISGVPVVDTAVADQLLKITRATRLMGCETLISGLSPAIARTIVELGVDTRGVRMMATLRDALRIGVSESSATRH